MAYLVLGLVLFLGAHSISIVAPERRVGEALSYRRVEAI
jgi:uncharacterized membrane protein